MPDNGTSQKRAWIDDDILFVHLPNELIQLRPVRADRLDAFDALQRIWLEAWLANEQSTGDTLKDTDTITAMRKALGMMPRADLSDAYGFDFQAIHNQYRLIEMLFFAESFGASQRNDDELIFDLAKYQGGLITKLHRFNPRKKLREAVLSRLPGEMGSQTEPSPQATFQSKEADPGSLTSSPNSPTASERKPQSSSRRRSASKKSTDSSMS